MALYSKFKMRIAALLWACALPLCAETTLSIPLLGYKFDTDTQMLKPILGTPGASMLGDQVNTGLSLAMAAVSPNADFVIGVSGDSGAVSLITLPGGATVDLPDTKPAPRNVVISPDGHAAALIYADSITILKGLPDQPAMVRELRDGLADIGPVAISDDAELVIARVGSVARLFNGDTWSNLALPGDIQSVAFRASSADVLISTTETLALIRDINVSGRSQNFPAAASSVGSAFVTANRILTLSSDGSVVSYDTVTGTAIAATCSCRPTGLYPLRLKGTFQLTNRPEDGLLLLDATSSAPRTRFVPRPQQ